MLKLLHVNYSNHKSSVKSMSIHNTYTNKVSTLPLYMIDIYRSGRVSILDPTQIYLRSILDPTQTLCYINVLYEVIFDIYMNPNHVSLTSS